MERKLGKWLSRWAKPEQVPDWTEPRLALRAPAPNTQFTVIISSYEPHRASFDECIVLPSVRVRAWCVFVCGMTHQIHRRHDGHVECDTPELDHHIML